jgi:hypothetical protein
VDKREIGDICGFVSCFYLRGVIAPVQKKTHTRKLYMHLHLLQNSGCEEINNFIQDLLFVEFDRGSGMQDPNNFREGSGKNRRHLKIFQQEDINNKKS